MSIMPLKLLSLLVSGTETTAEVTGKAEIETPSSEGIVAAMEASANRFQWLSWLADYPALQTLVAGSLLLILSLVLLFITRKFLLRLIAALAKRSPTDWDNIMVKNNVFSRLSWMVPMVIIQLGIDFVPHMPGELVTFIIRLASALMILVGIRAFAAVLTSVNEIYKRYPMATIRPIKGYLQVVSVIAHSFGGILILAALIGQSPWYFVSGIGAMMAVIMLLFRDTLLSLVAGIQMTANDLIRVGDWIEMPQFAADGDVVDIALNSVKVRNWDNTFTVIPTHKFLEHSFRNWRSMVELGGRRIMRSINVDVSTVSFLSEEQIDQFSKFTLLSDYIADKKKQLEEYNKEHCPNKDCLLNGRRLTNIGTFRTYIYNYCRQHPMIHQEMTFLVRQLEATPQGVPIQVYVFCKDTAWVKYEAIQGDIFDHLLAMVPEFGLRVFQTPSGADISGFTKEITPQIPSLAKGLGSKDKTSLPS